MKWSRYVFQRVCNSSRGSGSLLDRVSPSTLFVSTDAPARMKPPVHSSRTPGETRRRPSVGEYGLRVRLADNGSRTPVAGFVVPLAHPNRSISSPTGVGVAPLLVHAPIDRPSASPADPAKRAAGYPADSPTRAPLSGLGAHATIKPSPQGTSRGGFRLRRDNADPRPARLGLRGELAMARTAWIRSNGPAKPVPAQNTHPRKE